MTAISVAKPLNELNRIGEPFEILAPNSSSALGFSFNRKEKYKKLPLGPKLIYSEGVRTHLKLSIL